MSSYTNTVDRVGDAALCTAIFEKTLAEIVDTNCTKVGGYAFYKFSLLHTAIFANASDIEQYAFAHCSDLETVECPLSVGVGYYSFYACSKLKTADFPHVTSLAGYAFYKCTALETLALRSTTLATLADVNALENTKIASGAGYIYVPGALLDSYKADSEWSTYANQFRKLEDYTVDGTINGVLDTNRHMVRFFNGDTLLGYVMVSHGGSATYTGDAPAKGEDYEFTGWSPEPTNVTADMDCYAQFRSTQIVSRKLVERTLSGDYVNDRVDEIGGYAFYKCSLLTSATFPNATVIENYSHRHCSSLARVDLAAVTVIDEGSFQFCVKLDVFIVRNTTRVVTLKDTNALQDTKIARGNGYIYVPSALVDSYKTNSMWGTYANQIRAIEDYPEICGGEE